MAGQPEDFAFSLRDAAPPILLPYIRRQGRMHICYAYTTTEAVSALFAREYNLPPIELSTQQIVDQMPRNFNYAEKGRERDEDLGCYYGSHVDALQYAMNFGLFEDTAYPKRENSWDTDFPDPLPNEVRYKIGVVTRVRTENIDEEWQRVGFEDLAIAEAINQVLQHQPMVGAIRMYISFELFEGEEVYMGHAENEVDFGAHSVLIIGWGIKNRVEYFEIKNQWGEEWRDKGYAKVRKELIYRLAYPQGIVRLPPEGSGAQQRRAQQRRAFEKDVFLVRRSTGVCFVCRQDFEKTFVQRNMFLLQDMSMSLFCL